MVSWVQTFGQRLYQQYTCYTVFFVSIEICQISDVLIRKTRRLSVFQQGFFRSVAASPHHGEMGGGLHWGGWMEGYGYSVAFIHIFKYLLCTYSVTVKPYKPLQFYYFPFRE